MSEKRVTLKDVAEEVGCHRTTVGLALRNHPSISEERRNQILETANRMGYSPDPVLQALVAYRTRKGVGAYRGVIAVLTDFDTPAQWRKRAAMDALYKGMHARARKLGFTLEELPIGGVRAESRMNRILKARGIKHIIVSPLRFPGELPALDWASFSIVALGHTLQSPVFHRVAHHHRKGAELCMRRLAELGYRRVGVFLELGVDKRVDHGWSAAFHRRTLQAFDSVTWFQPSISVDDWACIESDFRSWIAKQQPEVIVTPHEIINHWLSPLVRSVDFVLLDRAADHTGCAGIDQKPEIVGGEAVSLVASLSYRGERGIPNHPIVLQVEGSWHEGSSLQGL